MTHAIAAQARAIVAAHERLALTPGASSRLEAILSTQAGTQPSTSGTLADPVTPAVLAAAQALDFWPADAHCIAQAWLHQTQRCGQFDPQAWPTNGQDYGLHAQAPSNAFAPCPQHLGLYAVLPDAQWVGRMARAGVPTLQLRFKSNEPQAIAAEVRAAVQAVQGTPALLFINDHWQAALEAGAYGVHLGQEDLDHADLNAIRTAGLRLGVSSHGYAEMLRAAALRPSYIALGAVFATTLKRMATPPQGVARLKVYRQLLQPFPTVAIGGIDAQRLPEVLLSGVGAVAVVRALVAAEQPDALAAELQATIIAVTSMQRKHGL
jgi:thiamine-phosphate pyrophosphorylase